MPTIFSTDGVVPLQQQLLTWNCCSYCVVMRTLLIIVIAFFHSDHQTMSKLIPIPAAPNPMVVSSAFRLQTELDKIPLNKDRNMRSTLSSTDHGHSQSAIKKILVTKGHCWNLFLSTMTFSNERTTSGEQAVNFHEGYNQCLFFFFLLALIVHHSNFHLNEPLICISIISTGIVNTKTKN